DERPGRRDRGGRQPRLARARAAELVARAGVPRADLGASAVIAQTRAELLKISSTRTTLGLLAGMLALVLLVVVLTGSLDSTRALGEPGNQRDRLGIGRVASLFAAIAGVLVIASEYRYGTIRPTFVFTPRRERVIAAKLVAGLLAGLAFGLLAEG